MSLAPSRFIPSFSSERPLGLQAGLRLLTSHLVVALVALVVIGGATRVMEAGLACPDWPLCYGSFLPGGRMNLQVFLEWFHRLDAFLVGVALLVFLGLAWWGRSRLPPWLPWAAALALLLVVVQGGLGALTVTGLLAAPTVTAHLGTALVLVLLLSGIHQALECLPAPASSSASLPPWWFALAALAAVLALGQCLLGGAMASQWAADRCLAAGEGCRWLLLHRQGASAAACGCLLLAPASLALPAGRGALRWLAFALAALVPVQILLGVFTLRLQLSIPAVTVAHQLLAALLVALIGAVWGRSLGAGSPTPFPADPEVAHG
ncbi:MAG: COX15/CtaA family protein [Cyanobacteriota bacterium]|jgi:cytochrome c oxidase assembly protein subunit 15